MGSDVDILVIGAGGCGLAAAIAGHDAGASVAVLEKQERPGGNTSLSTGSVPAAGSRFQREAGIDDDPERMVRDLMGIAKETDDLDLVHRLAGVSAKTVEWLVDEVGARIALVTAYKHIGHSVPRLHAPVSRRGQDLVDDLVSAVERRDIPIAVGNNAVGLIVEDGAAQGAIVETGGTRSEIRAGKTILSVNGFAGNPDLVRRFCPEIAGAEYFGARGSTGEAILWGEAIGADFANMAAYQGYAAVAYPQGSLLSWTTIEKGGFMIGDDARRFGDESLGYSGYARIVLGRRGDTYAVFDQKIFDVAAGEEEFLELWKHAGLKRGETPDEIGQIVGLDGAALADEVAAYNRAAGGEADRFGRRDFGLGPLKGPFYICRVVPGLFHTQGGLKVDGDGRVLRPAGKPVPNLFAGGGAAAGISGRSGALGYASGNGLLSAIALGRLAALAAARELRHPA
ncbi:MAG: fumarate reductase/succinate dehydrogenase flavoprotein domain protein [Geminicoccaceae bacterium]|jgi:fumarate reductase flavoprotein subunit|nr:fumarate reductase/succinate dehydrogenase flavoprotein domain protein [Geminicoccaceae bacterium]MDF3009339.1 fumarate reductase/succinate dehydrogenase flavoprotein domain protein [Burkholderiales bacterium]